MERMIGLRRERETGERQRLDTIFTVAVQDNNWCLLTLWLMNVWVFFAVTPPSAPVLRKSNGVKKPLQAKQRTCLFAKTDKITSSSPLPPSHHAVHSVYFSSKWPFAPGTQRDQTLHEYPYPLWLQLIVFSPYWLLKARLGRDHCRYRSVPCYRNKNLLAKIPFSRDER